MAADGDRDRAMNRHAGRSPRVPNMYTKVSYGDILTLLVRLYDAEKMDMILNIQAKLDTIYNF